VSAPLLGYVEQYSYNILQVFLAYAKTGLPAFNGIEGKPDNNPDNNPDDNLDNLDNFVVFMITLDNSGMYVCMYVCM